MLKLLTFNTLFTGNARARLRALAGLLEQSDLDVACLQEVFLRPNLNLLRTLTPSFPHAAWTPMGPFVRGGLLTISRHPIRSISSAVYKQRGRVTTIAAADRFIRKGLLATTIGVAGRTVAVINTHLLANYADDWSDGGDYATRQAAELEQLAGAVAGVDPALPLLVVGDLNVPGGTWLFDRFLEATGLVDARAPGATATFRPRPEGPPTHELDHVLWRPPQKGSLEVETRLLFDQPVRLASGRTAHLSDHLGIEARVRYHSAK